MVGLNGGCWHLYDVLVGIPASNGLRDGSYLGLISDKRGQLYVMKYLPFFSTSSFFIEFI